MNYKETHCDICNRNYRNCNFKRHKCNKKESEFRIMEEWKIFENLYNCPKCELKFSKMGLIGHYYRKHDIRGIKYLKDRKENAKIIKKLTKEERSTIQSNAMKKSHIIGKSKGWYFINADKNRRSYPEKFFINVFKINKLYEKFKIEEKFSYGKYFIDFLFVEIKLIVEVDGQQHYRTKEAIEHDRIRDEYFLGEGFRIYRINWKSVCTNSIIEINEFLNFIEDSNIKYRKYEISDCTRIQKCICGNKKTISSMMCMTCKRIKERKVKDRPSIDQLIIDINEMGYCGTGRKYGVSDNCIRKWVK